MAPLRCLRSAQHSRTVFLSRSNRSCQAKAAVTVLDGGMGHLLKQDKALRIEGLPYDEQSVASALACSQRPAAVTSAHKQYLDAGCTVLTTNSFSATPYHFKRARRTESYVEVAQVRVRSNIKEPSAASSAWLPS
jgi:methionine synthase I (cobalamin-dependent)